MNNEMLEDESILFPTLSFIAASVLVIIGAQVVSLSGSHVAILALIIPALWVLPQRGIAGLLLLTALTLYGLTLPYQSIALSVSSWVIFPLMMVAFSRRSGTISKVTSLLILVSLQIGLMITQMSDELDGNAAMTVIQTFAVMLAWFATKHSKMSQQFPWWSLGIFAPLWVAQLSYAIALTFCFSIAIAVIGHLFAIKKYQWGTLLGWALPTVAFSALMLTPTANVPNSVFVVWLCLLGTAWSTDYVLRVIESKKQKQ
ncbi:hypothetical protein [Vibrio genomosp. F10]|uniref:hypothetical protein n=1 Tax=Vibrio genomosp. F10 TaxID=723171 RepID=UPI001F51A766|nr:hypothetical protein [Vibrio genomosp. F10]